MWTRQLQSSWRSFRRGFAVDGFGTFRTRFDRADGLVPCHYTLAAVCLVTVHLADRFLGWQIRQVTLHGSGLASVYFLDRSISGYFFKATVEPAYPSEYSFYLSL